LRPLAGAFRGSQAGRMPIEDSLLGVSSPFVATAGDVLMTLVLAALLILPARLLWRRLTRRVERLAWSLRLSAKSDAAPMNPAADWLVGRWRESRLSFSQRLREARASIGCAYSHPAIGPAGDRVFRGLQSDLGIQLVLQYGELGDRHLSEDDGAAGRSVARQDGRCGRARLRRRRRCLSNQSWPGGR